MAEIDALVMKNVEIFLDKLQRSGITISQAYIFGSYAKGKANRWSDIDIAILSHKLLKIVLKSG